MENAINVEAAPVTRGKFWLTWFAWSALGYFVSILPTLVLNFLSDAGTLNFPAWSSIQSYVFILAILIEAFGIAWVQQRALRGVLKNNRLWFLVTFLGFTAFNLLNGGTYIGMINNIAQSTGSSGYETRQFEFTLLSYVAAFSGGLLFGVLQWLALRIESSRARWWIVWSSVAWLVYVFLTNLVFPLVQSIPAVAALATANPSLYKLALQLVGYVLYLSFPAISGIGLTFILIKSQTRQAEQAAKGKVVTVGSHQRGTAESRQTDLPQSGEDHRRKHLLIRLVLVTVLALLIGRLTYALGLTDVLAGIVIPASGDQQGYAILSALLYSVIAGVLMGWGQVWVLGPGYRRRWIWVLATGVGFMFETLNAQTPIPFVADWAQKGLAASPTLLYAFAGQVAAAAWYWLALGVIQAAALWQWAGKRAVGWILVVPVIQLVALFGRLLFGFPFEAALVAVFGGMALLFFLRSGWNAELVFSPLAGETPAADELELAATILEDRMARFGNLRGQVAVEDDLLVVSFENPDEAGFITGLAQQQGNAAFFEAGAAVEAGSQLPAGANVLLTDADVESVRILRSGEDRRPFLRVKLGEDGFTRLNEFWNGHKGFKLGLALDREVLTSFALNAAPEADGLLVEGLPEEDVEFVASVLDNDPLPFALEVVEEESAEQSALGTANAGA